MGSLIHVVAKACRCEGISLRRHVVAKACVCQAMSLPHEKLLGITWVSNLATRKDLAARTWGVFWY